MLPGHVRTLPFGLSPYFPSEYSAAAEALCRSQSRRPAPPSRWRSTFSARSGPQSQVLLALWGTTDWHEPPVTFFLCTSSGYKQGTTHNGLDSTYGEPSRVLAHSPGIVCSLQVCCGVNFSSLVGILQRLSDFSYPSPILLTV